MHSGCAYVHSFCLGDSRSCAEMLEKVLTGAEDVSDSDIEYWREHNKNAAALSVCEEKHDCSHVNAVGVACNQILHQCQHDAACRATLAAQADAPHSLAHRYLAEFKRIHDQNPAKILLYFLCSVYMCVRRCLCEHVCVSVVCARGGLCVCALVCLREHACVLVACASVCMCERACILVVCVCGGFLRRCVCVNICVHWLCIQWSVCRLCVVFCS